MTVDPFLDVEGVVATGAGAEIAAGAGAELLAGAGAGALSGGGVSKPEGWLDVAGAGAGVPAWPPAADSWAMALMEGRHRRRAR